MDKRPYRSAVRAEAARRTRRAVVDAARGLFVERGYPGTTIADVARAARVSQDTVYTGFGTKAALLKTVVDVTVAGDDEPVPFAARPEARAIDAAPDAVTALTVYAEWATHTLSRWAPVLTALRTARGDPDVDALLTDMDRQRLEGARMLATAVAAKPDATVGVAQLRDVVFVVASVETYDLAVTRRGWSARRYTGWVATTLVAAAVAPPAEASPPGRRGSGR